MNIKQMDPQFKATHVSMGLNHIAVIVNYAILDLIDITSKPPNSIIVTYSNIHLPTDRPTDLPAPTSPSSKPTSSTKGGSG